MKVNVKLVVFYNHEWREYCSYSPELQCFLARGTTVEEVLNVFKEKYLLWELKNRYWYKNLWIRGWKITENSIIPPIFTDEEALKLAEKSYERQIVDHQIIVVNVEVPPPTGRRNISGFYQPD